MPTEGSQHQPEIHVDGSLLNRINFTILKQLVFKVNLVFSPRTHKCRVGAGKKKMAGAV